MQVFTKSYPETVFENYVAVVRDLGVEPFSRHSNREIVAQGFGSPYRFGNLMRKAVDDEFAPIYCCNGVYWCVAATGLVSFYRSGELNAAQIPSSAVEFVQEKQLVEAA
jgi:hypothetical protein